MTVGFEGLLQALQIGDEASRLEAKKGSESGKSIGETMCAFANEPGLSGGHIILGLSRASGQRYDVVGVNDPDKIQTDIVTQARTTFNVPVKVEVSRELYDGKPVLVIYVAEAHPSVKPVYFKKKGLPGGAFRRIGSVDQVCTDEDLAELYALRGGDTFDQTVVRGSTTEDLDLSLVESYRKARRQTSLTGEEVKLDDQSLLYALNCTDKRRDPSCTIAGLLLFGRREALRRHMPMTRVDYIRSETREWVSHPDSRYHTTVEMREALFTLIPKVITTILDDIPRSFSLPKGSSFREDVPLIPRAVVREAIVNALMHRDLRARRPVQIIRYPNRIEIRNPGYSLVPEETLGEPGSVSRNEKIAAVLHEVGLAETKGTGIRTMRAAMKSANLSVPIFHSNRADNTFTVILLVHHFLGSEDIEWLGRFRSCNLNEDEAKTLVAAREIGAVSNSVVRDMCGLDTLAASGLLRRMRDLELLEQKGAGPATYYEPSLKLLGQETGTHPVQIELELESSPRSNEISPRNNETSPRSNEINPRNNETNVRFGHVDFEKLAGELGKRTNPDKLKFLIWGLCLNEPRSRAEIAETVRRSERRVDQILSEMLKSGQLRYHYPDSTSHPDQAYKAGENVPKSS